MRDVSPLRQAGDFSGCTKTCAMMHGAQPSPTSKRLQRLHQKPCAMMRDVALSDKQETSASAPKPCAMMHDVSPLLRHRQRQARERMALNLLKISGLMQCPPLGFPYKEGYLIY